MKWAQGMTPGRRGIRMVAFVTLASAAAGCGDDGEVTEPDAAVVHGGDIELRVGRSSLRPDDLVDGQLVLFQDGQGPWQPMPGRGGIYQAHVDNDHFGVALACQNADVDYPWSSLWIHHGTVAEGRTVQGTDCRFQGYVAVSGTLSGPGSDTATGLNGPTMAGPPTRYAASLPPGDNELFFETGGNVARSGVFTVDSPTTHDISWTTAAANRMWPVTGIDPSGFDQVYSLTEVHARSGKALFVTNTPAPAVVNLGAAIQAADDVYLHQVVGQNAGGQVQVSVWAGPGAPSVALPAPWSVPEAYVTQQSPRRTAHPVTVDDGFEGMYEFSASAAGNLTVRPSPFWQHSAQVSPGWLRATGVTAFEFPDLTTMPGWRSGMYLPDELAVGWTTRRTLGGGPTGIGRVETMASSYGYLGMYCGDQVATGDEECDDSGRSTPACDSDCTLVMCGDGLENTAAGEQCDPPTPGLCSATCQDVRM